ncbi:MAG: polysaccharide biosynthesis protein GtrA [Bradyrhizobium sp.]|nr:polysaccharide biosynthesis protein GtrA [Bradyrhizobium sp.]
MTNGIGEREPKEGNGEEFHPAPLQSRSNLRSGIAKLARFGIVGVSATLVYFSVTAVLGGTSINLNPIISNMLGVAASLSISYFGHHRFTFSALGQHGRYLPRFLFVMTTLFLLSCGVMAAGSYLLKLNHTLLTAFIAVFFPAVSFLVNMLWTFAHKNENGAD